MTVQSFEPHPNIFCAGDADAVSDLICRCLRESNAKDYPPDVIEDLIAAHTPAALIGKFSAGEFSLVIRDGGTPIGVGIISINGPFSYISTMFVSPDKQGQGVGRLIISGLEAHSILRDRLVCRLNASITAIGFYERCGYREVEKQDRELGGETLLMEKRL